MKIVLLGYMGSGKSTIGRLLGSDLNLDFIDLDTYIETYEHEKIPAIFNQRGELYFRKKEHIYLNDILLEKQNFVMATGGGTPCYSGNMALITNNTTASFYLKLSVKGLVDRLIKEKADRPLIKNIPDTDMSEFIGKHLFERSYYYNMAKYSINIDNKAPTEIVEEIKKYLFKK
ncbi:MAG: shikimate kinase [Maribacter sp.]|nr:shikimate kinase [Maribacter sp.]